MSRMKYVWAAALLALLVGISAGSALAALSWAPGADTIPDTMYWEQAASATIESTNDGTVDWGTNIGIASVETPGSAVSAVTRWGASAVALGSTVAPAGTNTWNLSLVAPPIATITYQAPVTDTGVPVATGLECEWALTDGGALQALPVAGQDVTIYRFKDLLPTTLGLGEIQECAGRVPLIAAGYADGTYKPGNNVTRGQLAAFLMRALKLAPVTPAGTVFLDVAATDSFAAEIETVAGASLINGYDVTGGKEYRPANNVNRGQMAQMLSSAVYGSSVLPDPAPGTQSFTDVAPTYGFYKAIEWGVANGLIKGYLDSTYKPTNNVNRAQMATFLWRAFVKPTDCVVVLAGPGFTTVDPTTATYNGWSPVSSGLNNGSVYAYVGIDVLRAGTTDPVTVTFDLVDDTDAVAATANGDLDAGTFAAAKTAATTSGVPYLYSSAAFDLSTLAVGNYTLVVTVNGEELSRQPAFEVLSSAPATDFSASATVGVAPLSVDFTDTSALDPTSWSWDFGDSSTSTEQNPSHTYATVGDFTVALTATNANGSSTETKTNYIATYDEVVYESEITFPLGGSIVSGTLADTQANDDAYMAITAPGTLSYREHFVTGHTVAEVSKLRVDLTFRSDVSDPDAMPWAAPHIRLAENNGTFYSDAWHPVGNTDVTETWETSDTTHTVAEVMSDAGDFRTMHCMCGFGGPLYLNSSVVYLRLN